jgi:hypothetical protein
MGKQRRLVGALGVAAALAFGAVGVAGATGGTTNPGDQGCTPGYWKNHTDSWVYYSPSGTIGDTLPGIVNLNGVPGSTTLLAALDGGGGPGAKGATQILIRALVAGKLNSAQLSYPDVFKDSQVAAAVAAINAGDRDAMLALAAQIDAQNNLGCPLN